MSDADIRRYVLGTLTGDAREALEERVLTDSSQVDEIEMVEADIVDAYVQGRLEAEERAAFERRLAGSELLRRKVAFSRALAVAAARPRGERRMNASWMWLAAAASVALVVGASWLLRERQREAPTVVQQPAPPPVSAPAPGPATPFAPPVVATLTLWGAMPRDAASSPAVAIPASARGVLRIDIGLEAGDTFPTFSVEITGTAGASVFRADNLVASTAASGPTLHVGVPVDTMAPGRYRVRVRGQGRGAATDVAAYEFRVTR